MDYLTVRETAETWNLSLRTVQQLCAQGRIPGAKKFGKFWAIPAGAAKPQVSQQDQLLAEGPSAPGGQLDAANLMPLMNTPFLPGQCRAAVEAMPPGPRRDIALAEYHYFTGHPEEAAQEAQPYLDSDDVGARLSACLVYAYANLSIGEICRAKFALGELSTSLAAAGERSPQFQAASAFVAAAGAVLLHLPLPEGLPDTQDFLPLLPQGLRAFALYIQAHYLYLKGEYGPSAGLVEGPWPSPTTSSRASGSTTACWGACWRPRSNPPGRRISSGSSPSPTAFPPGGEKSTTQRQATTWPTTSPPRSSPSPCWPPGGGPTRRSPPTSASPPTR